MIQPTTEIRGAKFEVIQLIRFGTGILNLASRKSETQAARPLHSVLGVLSEASRWHIQAVHLSHLTCNGHAQFAFIFIALYKGSSTSGMSLCDSVVSAVWVYLGSLSFRNQLRANII